MKHSLFLLNQQSASRARAALTLAALLSVALLLPLRATAGIALTETDNGSSVSVTLNETFTLTLPSSADGGYQWVITGLNTAKLRMLSKTVDTSECPPPPAVGCSGDDVFTFKAIGTGQSTLSLVSRQSWNPNNPAASFSVTVNILPGTSSEGEGEALPAVVLTGDDNGKTINVKLNDEFAVKLASGADGGYEWVVTAMDATILENSGHTVDTSECSPEALGCSGNDIFIFTADKAGQTALTLESQRSGDTENPGATFSVTVVVSEDSDENGCERFLSCIGGTVGTTGSASGPGPRFGGDVAILGAMALLFVVLGKKSRASCSVR